MIKSRRYLIGGIDLRTKFLILMLIIALAALTYTAAGCARNDGDAAPQPEPGATAAETSPATPAASPTVSSPAPEPKPEPTPELIPEPTVESPEPTDPTPVDSPFIDVRTNDIIQLGGYNWRVLDISDGRALVLSDIILECRAYHDIDEETSWLMSDIRNYLNGKFFNETFSTLEKALIVETPVENDSNPWFSTPGGTATNDKLFLLSLREVVEYFGDSGQLDDPEYDSWIGDDYCSARICEDASGEATWWWLRSPGRFRELAASVADDGFIYVYGGVVSSATVGIRPALWLRLG